MKLYLHCGYHKTGSSFLQTLFSRYRKQLQENGFHFPTGEREYDMLSGNISPGNGSELAAALKKKDKQYANELINSYTLGANKKRCNTILLSSENFFHAFEKEKALQDLTSIAKENGIDTIHALLYFRDPVPHALSTFKHRAKNGRIPDLSGWLETEYETMGLIEQFMNCHRQNSIYWTFRKYRTESVHMARSAFTEWLGINTPDIPEDDRVNTSLTLSELLAIQTLNKNRSEFIPFVKEAFAGLPACKKAADKELIRRYTAVASSKLIGYKFLIQEVNRLLPQDEQLKLTSPTKIADDKEQEAISLTKHQVDAFVAGIEAGTKSHRLMQKIKAILMKLVSRANRIIKTFRA